MNESLATFQASAGKLLMLLFLSTLLYGLAELLYLRLVKKVANLKEYRTTALALGFALLVSICVSLLYARVNTAIIGIWASQWRLLDTDLTWYWWVYGLVVYEFFYWVQHYLAHKVRLLWCLHSPHHAPESMHMFVGFNHSFLESLFYMPFFLGFFPALLGVDPVIIIVINMVDAIWGSMIHISDYVVKGRLGFLERFMQTPAYHRAHHARNILYLDMNYCSITLLWDWLLGTLQPLDDHQPPAYGIMRAVDTTSFWDTHFGEFGLLARDMHRAPGLANKLRYLLMPPGWSHETGALRTAAYLRHQHLDAQAKAPQTR
jgi:sterol desaturase/sphingolipid hydroxylase (fatty acid hydroxylase superfamily)